MHCPVLLSEALDGLQVGRGGRYLDGTAGGGGHAAALLQRLGDRGWLLALDRDAEAVGRVRARLAPWGAAARVEQGNFADMDVIARQCGWERVEGVLLDLGMSSDQVDAPERGFSFMNDGPLDMRMDRAQGRTAADLVNRLDETALADLFWRLGEERGARRIARAIVAERARAPITTTGRLADVVARAGGGRRGRIHPATKIFQALRMAVNAELENLEKGLEAALRLLTPGGRLAVLAFHSLEDRVVKQTVGRHVPRWESLPAGGRRRLGLEPPVRWITRRPLRAADEECAANPRARSARLRVAESVSAS
ncbi:MAG: 16S rRNA (cytosine(1402)-N(4))-methyltransferase RsmH [Kiritimatiellaeota bacterium]|nr:16S rRNA (cytosine(1402)-N(4))-methyltransferase RsmH [Kiritimatiellota bacterium]